MSDIGRTILNRIRCVLSTRTCYVAIWGGLLCMHPCRETNKSAQPPPAQGS